MAGKLKPVMTLAVKRRAPMVLEPQLGLLVVGEFKIFTKKQNYLAEIHLQDSQDKLDIDYFI